MVRCVEALHKLGHIHYDLKPDNFLVSPSGKLILIDFGVSQPYTTTSFYSEPDTDSEHIEESKQASSGNAAYASRRHL